MIHLWHKRWTCWLEQSSHSKTDPTFKDKSTPFTLYSINWMKRLKTETSKTNRKYWWKMRIMRRIKETNLTNNNKTSSSTSLKIRLRSMRRNCRGSIRSLRVYIEVDTAPRCCRCIYRIFLIWPKLRKTNSNCTTTFSISPKPSKAHSKP